jgi:hypothetical protein
MGTINWTILDYWAEGSCITSQRFHEAALRVIVSPIWGPNFNIRVEAVNDQIKIYKEG